MARFNGSRLSEAARRRALIEERVFKGIELYRRGRIRFPYRQAGDGLKVGKTLFGVLWDSKPGEMYIVELAGGRWACTCPDFEKRGEWLGVCKHIAAVLAYKGELRCVLCGRPAGLSTTCLSCQAEAAQAQAAADAAYCRAADLEALLFG